MRNDHFDCDCLECQSDSFQGFQERDNVDSKNAGYYLDSQLKAKKRVTVYKTPDTKSPIIKVYEPGANVGIIYSWVLRNGILWWEINWFSGKHQGWVKHDPSLFNTKIIEDTAGQKVLNDKQAAIKKEYDDNNPLKPIKDLGTGISKVVSGAGDSIGFIGTNMKWILLVVIIVSLAYAYKAFKS